MFAIMFSMTIVADVVQGIIAGGVLASFTANRIIGFFTFLPERTIFSGIIQGIIVGGVLAFITANIIMNVVVKSITTTANGWSITLKCGQPGNGILLRAACAKILPAVNVAQEAAYWTTTIDSAGRALNGKRDYVLHFPVGQLPPNDAFWSLTMTDVVGYMVSNPINRYSVGGRSGLVPNTDGSIDIYIQTTAPAGHESNWLPAPAGNFKLMLRAYLPGRAILDGEYHVPPVIKVQ
jgi:hypothetical protein